MGELRRNWRNIFIIIITIIFYFVTSKAQSWHDNS